MCVREFTELSIPHSDDYLSSFEIHQWLESLLTLIQHLTRNECEFAKVVMEHACNGFLCMNVSVWTFYKGFFFFFHFNLCVHHYFSQHQRHTIDSLVKTLYIFSQSLLFGLRWLSPSVWTHLMVFAVGICTASVMESGSRVCLRILFSVMPVVLNYQIDCLSSLFAWILISPNSVLTPSGECVGDGERKSACVCYDAQ